MSFPSASLPRASRSFSSRPSIGQTVASAVPGLDTRASRAASLKGWFCGRITEAERTRWCASSTPGGVASFSASILAARNRRCRAMMMPLSVLVRRNNLRTNTYARHDLRLR